MNNLKPLPTTYRGYVRIISGIHRGRRIPVPKHLPIRPTPDRIRETLFNWLQSRIVGSRCLDVFAGSGALGFEAASRGAQHVWMWDAHPGVCQHLKSIQSAWKLSQLLIEQRHLPEELPKAPAPFDIVFLDPPYEQLLLQPTLEALLKSQFIGTQSLIYIEHATHDLEVESLKTQFQFLKTSKSGNVSSALLSLSCFL